jgi:hypothetical protein
LGQQFCYNGGPIAETRFALPIAKNAMRRSEKFANPFYVLLVIAGLSFAMTAFAYGVMAVRENAAVRGETELGPPREHPLIAWMREHGDAALITELSLLAACTFGAISTDEYWQRRAAAQRKAKVKRE